MEALMQLQIITPDRLMCDESVKMVEMRTAEEIGRASCRERVCKQV